MSRPPKFEDENVFNSWLIAEQANGVSISQALREMNEELDTKTDAARLHKWRTGEKFPRNSAVINYALTRTLDHLLKKKIKKAKREKIITAASMPPTIWE